MFSDEDFRWILFISKKWYYQVREEVQKLDPFFEDTYDCTGWLWISPDAKILVALKVLAYGCSANRWKNYFQLCELELSRFIKKYVYICIEQLKFL